MRAVKLASEEVQLLEWKGSMEERSKCLQDCEAVEVALEKNAGRRAAGVGVAVSVQVCLSGQCFGAWGGPENVVHPETGGLGKDRGWATGPGQGWLSSVR